MMYLSICGTLLTLIAAMYFLAKVNRENLGSFIKWITYAVITIALLILICQLTRGIGKMTCSKEKCKTECKMDGMGGPNKMMMQGMRCEREEMECCEEMEQCMENHKCKGDKKCEGEMKDSTAKE